MKKLLFASLFLVHCGGELAVSAYGEAFIEQGIPSSVFSDGYAVTLSEFSVTFEQVKIASTVVEESKTLDLVNASGGEGQQLGSARAPDGIYSDLSFSITKVVVKGIATKPGVSKAFAWAFSSPTHYAHCDAKTQVGAGAPARAEITVHADHLFFDSLVSEEPEVRFQPIADADANADDTITELELRAASLGTYDPGNATPHNLWEYLELLSHTFGHVNGEGHCEASTTK